MPTSNNYCFLNMGNIFLYVLLLQATAILAEPNCDKLGVRVYEDMGCKPNYRSCSRKCPDSFSCPNLHESTSECYYKNLTLKIDESVNHPDQFCNIACFCDTGGIFVCAAVDCAEYFGMTPPPGCYRTYDLTHCCSSGEICEQSNFTCNYGGETYKEGIRFFPKDSCAMCVCQKGFRGKLEAPFCTRRKCNVQLRNWKAPQQKCAPVYNIYDTRNTDILCCPDYWICPNGTEIILGTGISSKVCFFGDRKVKAGQRIEKYIGSTLVTCECKIPPLLTCVHKQ